jgi:hypothetical protein
LIDKLQDSDQGPELKNLDDFLLGDESPLKRKRKDSDEGRNMDKLELIRPTNMNMETGIRNSVDMEELGDVYEQQS